MKYSIDTSAILEAWRRSYPPDVLPDLWEGLAELAERGDLRATEEVRYELERKDDEVCEWAKTHSTLFVEIDDNIQVVVQDILKHHKKLLDTRKNRSGADPFVIALAQVHQCTVVSNERRTRSPKRPNIPDVCDSLGIRRRSRRKREQGG